MQHALIAPPHSQAVAECEGDPRRVEVLGPVFAQPGDAVFVAESGRRIVWRNDRAGEVLSAGDLCQAVAGLLAFVGPEAPAIDAAWAGLAQQPHGASAILAARRAGAPVLIRIAVLHRGHVAVTLVDPMSPRVPRAEALHAAFGLTRAETAVAQDLALGLTAKQIAHRRNLTEATIRTHLRAIYAKIGLGRLSSIVAVLTTCARI